MSTTHTEPALSEALLAAMDTIVSDAKLTPDTGEGGLFDIRSSFAWNLRDDYMHADDPKRAEYFEPGMTPDDIRAACLRDAARAIARWMEATS